MDPTISARRLSDKDSVELSNRNRRLSQTETQLVVDKIPAILNLLRATSKRKIILNKHNTEDNELFKKETEQYIPNESRKEEKDHLKEVSKLGLISHDKRKFAISIATLAFRKENQLNIVNEGAVKLLISMANTDDVVIQASCASAFNSLACGDMSVRKLIIEEGCIPIIVNLSSLHGSHILFTTCCNTLCNLLAVPYGFEARALRDGVLSVTHTADISYDTILWCLKLILNLSCVPDKFMKIEDLVEALFRLSVLITTSTTLTSQMYDLRLAPPPTKQAARAMSFGYNNAVDIQQIHEHEDNNDNDNDNDNAKLNNNNDDDDEEEDHNNETQLCILGALVNLSALKGFQLHLVDDGCIKLVEKAVVAKSQEIRRLGIEIVLNLLFEPKARIKLLDTGILQIIVTLLNDQTFENQDIPIKILCVQSFILLSTAAKCRDKMMDTGCMVIFMKCAIEHIDLNTELIKLYVRALRIFCGDEKLNSVLVNNGIMKALLALMQHSDNSVYQLAVEAIGCLFHSFEILSVLMNDNTLIEFLHLYKITTNPTRNDLTDEWMVYALYQLSLHYETSKELIENEIILQCVQFFSQTKNIRTKYICTVVLEYITRNRDLKNATSAIEILVQGLNTVPPTAATLTSGARATAHTSNTNKQSNTSNSTNTNNNSNSNSNTNNANNNMNDQNSIKKSIVSNKYLNDGGNKNDPDDTAVSGSSRPVTTTVAPASLTLRGVPLYSGVRVNAAGTLYNLAANDQSCHKMLEIGAFGPIVALAESSDTTDFQTKVKCVAILSRLSFHKDFYPQFESENFLNLLLDLLTSDNIQILRYSVTALANITQSITIRTKIIKLNGIINIANLSSKVDEIIRRGFALILCNLASDKGNEKAMVTVRQKGSNSNASEVISTLLVTAMISSDQVSTKILCVKTLMNLSADLSIIDEFVKDGAIWGLSSLYLVQSNAASAAIDNQTAVTAAVALHAPPSRPSGVQFNINRATTVAKNMQQSNSLELQILCTQALCYLSYYLPDELVKVPACVKFMTHTASSTERNILKLGLHCIVHVLLDAVSSGRLSAVTPTASASAAGFGFNNTATTAHSSSNRTNATMIGNSNRRQFVEFRLVLTTACVILFEDCPTDDNFDENNASKEASNSLTVVNEHNHPANNHSTESEQVQPPEISRISIVSVELVNLKNESIFNNSSHPRYHPYLFIKLPNNQTFTTNALTNIAKESDLKWTQLGFDLKPEDLITDNDQNTILIEAFNDSKLNRDDDENDTDEYVWAFEGDDDDRLIGSSHVFPNTAWESITNNEDIMTEFIDANTNEVIGMLRIKVNVDTLPNTFSSSSTNTNTNTEVIKKDSKKSKTIKNEPSSSFFLTAAADDENESVETGEYENDFENESSENESIKITQSAAAIAVATKGANNKAVAFINSNSSANTSIAKSDSSNNRSNITPSSLDTVSSSQDKIIKENEAKEQKKRDQNEIFTMRLIVLAAVSSCQHCRAKMAETLFLKDANLKQILLSDTNIYAFLVILDELSKDPVTRKFSASVSEKIIQILNSIHRLPVSENKHMYNLLMLKSIWGMSCSDVNTNSLVINNVLSLVHDVANSIALAPSDHEELSLYIVYTIYNLSNKSSVYTGMITHGAVIILSKLWDKDFYIPNTNKNIFNANLEIIRTVTIKSLCHLCVTEHLSVTEAKIMVSHGCVPMLNHVWQSRRLITTNNSKLFDSIDYLHLIDRSSAALRNLCCYENVQTILVQQGGLDCLIEIANYCFDTMQSYAEKAQGILVNNSKLIPGAHTIRSGVMAMPTGLLRESLNSVDAPSISNLVKQGSMMGGTLLQSPLLANNNDTASNKPKMLGKFESNKSFKKVVVNNRRMSFAQSAATVFSPASKTRPSSASRKSKFEVISENGNNDNETAATINTATTNAVTPASPSASGSRDQVSEPIDLTQLELEKKVEFLSISKYCIAAIKFLTYNLELHQMLIDKEAIEVILNGEESDIAGVSYELRYQLEKESWENGSRHLTHIQLVQLPVYGYLPYTAINLYSKDRYTEITSRFKPELLPLSKFNLDPNVLSEPVNAVTIVNPFTGAKLTSSYNLLQLQQQNVTSSAAGKNGGIRPGSTTQPPAANRNITLSTPSNSFKSATITRSIQMTGMHFMSSSNHLNNKDPSASTAVAPTSGSGKMSMMSSGQPLEEIAEIDASDLVSCLDQMPSIVPTAMRYPKQTQILFDHKPSNFIKCVQDDYDKLNKLKVKSNTQRQEQESERATMAYNDAILLSGKDTHSSSISSIKKDGKKKKTKMSKKANRRCSFSEDTQKSLSKINTTNTTTTTTADNGNVASNSLDEESFASSMNSSRSAADDLPMCSLPYDGSVYGSSSSSSSSGGGGGGGITDNGKEFVIHKKSNWTNTFANLTKSTKEILVSPTDDDSLSGKSVTSSPFARFLNKMKSTPDLIDTFGGNSKVPLHRKNSKLSGMVHLVTTLSAINKTMQKSKSKANLLENGSSNGGSSSSKGGLSEKRDRIFGGSSRPGTSEKSSKSVVNSNNNNDQRLLSASSTLPVPLLRTTHTNNQIKRPNTSTYTATSIAATAAANRVAEGIATADGVYVRGSRQGLKKMKPTNFKKEESSLLDAIKQSKLNHTSMSTETMLDDWRMKSKFH